MLKSKKGQASAFGCGRRLSSGCDRSAESSGRTGWRAVYTEDGNKNPVNIALSAIKVAKKKATTWLLSTRPVVWLSTSR
jgi:hypothetical protein